MQLTPNERDGLYFDHATTSRPKAPGVVLEVTRVLSDICVSPGRTHHGLGRLADELLEGTRRNIARMFGVAETNVVFTSGATHALNLAIAGILRPGDHAIATCFDHNSVLRPLKSMESRGCKVTFVHPNSRDRIADAVVREFRPETKLVVLCHASNVCGTILPIEEIGDEAQRRGILVLLDAAQSAGHIDIDLSRLPADFAVISGHKGLLGPPGVGCLLVKNRQVSLAPLMTGGTGHESGNMVPQLQMPVSYEVGTQNLPAIAGLGAALKFVQSEEYQKSLLQLTEMCEEFLQRVARLPFASVHRPALNLPSVPIVPITMDGQRPDQIARRLDEQYGIQTRSGLHCAPLVHDYLGTSPLGAVRIAFGFGNQPSDVDRLCDALTEIGSKG